LVGILAHRLRDIPQYTPLTRQFLGAGQGEGSWCIVTAEFNMPARISELCCRNMVLSKV
jgi:hypothetical protein